MVNPKRERFCQEYVIDLNATQAAIRAGYSPKTAQPASARLLSNVMVSARIAELQAKVTTKLEITAERILNELARIAFFDIRKLYHDDGRLKEPIDLDEDTARAISAVDACATKITSDDKIRTSERTTKIKASDKKGALDLLAKHLGLFNEKLRVTLDDPARRIFFVAPDSGRDPVPPGAMLAK